jgi:GNAT superfamily N-acetyltransferase
MNGYEFHIIKYSTGYKEAALELLCHLWTHLSKEDQKIYFEWRYEQNPYCDKPYIYLALKEKKVIGFRAFVLQPFVSSATGRLNAFTPADSIVHPAYRGKGLFRMLNTAFFTEVQSSSKGKAVIFNLSSNESSTPANLRQGWQATNGMKRFALKFSWRNYILRRCYGQKIKMSAPSVTIKHNIELQNTLKPGEMALCAERYRNPAKISHIRDIQYFKWRYAFKQDKYLFVYSWYNEELLAYLVLEKKSDTQYLLIEYAARDAGVLRNIIRFAMRKQVIPFLRSWALSDDEAVMLRGCGFLPAPLRLWKMLGKQRLPVLVRPIKEAVQPQDFLYGQKDIRDINNWQFFIADRH